MSKQYLLNFDDTLVSSFMTKENTEQLIIGANDSGARTPFAVAVGGSGNNSFTPGQTLIFNGTRFVSSGYDPLPFDPSAWTNDDRYYTKAEVDDRFASLGADGGFPVAYSNLTGAPAVGLQIQFLTAPIAFFSGTTAQASRQIQSLSSIPVDRTVVAALLATSCRLQGPNSGYTAAFRVSGTISSAQLDVGWFRANGGGDDVAACTNSVVPVVASSFYYQLTGVDPAGGADATDGTVIADGPVTSTIIGYLYQ